MEKDKGTKKIREIKIEKGLAIRREKIKRWSWLFIGTIIWFVILNMGYNIFQLFNFEENFGLKFSFFFYSFIFMCVWEYAYYKFFLLEINSLKYSIDEKENRLISRWKVILKHTDTAKLQVINSVDIDQDIWDKFVNLYSVDVQYGFSGSGYNYYFNYLSEEQAEELLKKIKPSGRLGVSLE